MNPTETRLLNAIRDALAPLRAATSAGDTARIVNSIDVALNELLLRSDLEFIAEFVSAGRRIEQDAAAMGAAPLAADPASPASGDAGAEIDGGKLSPVRLARSLAQQADQLVRRESGDAAVKRLLARMVDWENTLHLRRVRPPSAPVAANKVEGAAISAVSIRDYLLERYPEWGNVRVSNLQRPAGGFSKATVLFDVEDDINGLRSWVIRAEQSPDLVFLEGADLGNEFHVLQLAAAAGLPVAQPLLFEGDPKPLGARFLISKRAEGRNFGSRVDVRERISDKLLRDVVGRLVQLHRTAVDPAADHVMASHLGRWAAHATLRECVAAQVEFWRAGAEKSNIPPSPLLTRVFGWLQRNIPDNHAPPVLLHGDFGLHNLLISDDERVACILDWEAATLGDPVDDLVWLSEGLRGSVERDEIVALYEELGGRRIDKALLPFFDVMCSMRFAVTCPRALDLFEQYPQTGLDALQLGLLYMYHGTGEVNRHIERADQALATFRKT